MTNIIVMTQGGTNTFYYRGQLISEDKQYITIQDINLGTIKINKQQIITRKETEE